MSIVDHRQPDPDVLIVGAGHNGLTAGCCLAKEGLRVLIVEAAADVGGMTSTNAVLDRAPGHLVSEGAMDSSLWRTTSIAQDLGLANYGLVELDIDTPYAFLDEDGSSLCIHRDPVRMLWHMVDLLWIVLFPLLYLVN